MKTSLNPFDAVTDPHPVTATAVTDFALAAVETAYMTNVAVIQPPSAQQCAAAWTRFQRCLLVAGKWQGPSHQLYLALSQHPSLPEATPAVAKALGVASETASRWMAQLIGDTVHLCYAHLRAATTAAGIHNQDNSKSRGRDMGTWGNVLMPKEE